MRSLENIEHNEKGRKLRKTYIITQCHLWFEIIIGVVILYLFCIAFLFVDKILCPMMSVEKNDLAATWWPENGYGISHGMANTQ